MSPGGPARDRAGQPRGPSIEIEGSGGVVGDENLLHTVVIDIDYHRGCLHVLCQAQVDLPCEVGILALDDS